jgi:prepilin signal peptidase PulO-like enzyme (type II secretory pathway)
MNETSLNKGLTTLDTGEARAQRGLHLRGYFLPFAGLCLAQATVVFIALPDWPIWGIAIAMTPALIWIALCDLKSRIIPDPAQAVLAVIGLGLAGEGNFLLTAGIAVGVAAVLAVLGEVIWRVRGLEVLGLGDVKLIGAGILIVGAESAWLMILLASVGGLIAGMLSREGTNREIPFGPFLAYSILLTFLLNGPR